MNLRLHIMKACGRAGLLAAVVGLLAGPAVSAAAGATAKAPDFRPPPVRSVGCGSDGLSPGRRTVGYSAAGDSGLYLIAVPASYRSGRPMPIVMDLHGYADPAAVQASITGLSQYGDEHGFITVTPQVDYAVPQWDTSLGGKDLSFLSDLLTSLEHSGCINQRRVYVAGYSDGAFMTSAVACQLSARVAAVAPVAGIQDTAGCRPARPVPVVAFHGTADPFVPYNGGIGSSTLSLPAPNGSGQTIGDLLKNDPSAARAVASKSVPAETAGWARRNGCRRSFTAVRVASDVTRIVYRCPPQASVELYRVTGGGHAWPGSRVSAALVKVVGRTTFSISANQIMWKFFEAHPLTG